MFLIICQLILKSGQIGYILQGRTIRPAAVGVSRKPWNVDIGLGTKEHFVLNSAQGDFSVTWKCGKPEIHLLPSLNICFAESFLVGLCCLYTFLSVYYHLLHYLLFADLLLCWSFTCLLVCWFLFFCVFLFVCSFLLVPWPFDIWGIFNHVCGFVMWLVHRAEIAQQMTTNLNL